MLAPLIALARIGHIHLLREIFGGVKVKADLAIQIIKAMRRLSLTQQDAAKRMGLPSPNVGGCLLLFYMHKYRKLCR